MRYFWRASVLKIMNARFVSFVLVMFMAAFYYVPQITKVSAELEYPITWCIFPFLFNANVFISLFWLGIIYLNTDIPFMQYSGMYQVIRCGRRKWMLANLLGMFFRSFMAVLAAAACSIVPLLPYMELSNDWGKLLYTYVLTDLSKTDWLDFTIPYEIFGTFSPVQMMLLMLLLLTLIAMFLGVLMLTLSLYGNRRLAVAADVLLVLMVFLVLNAAPQNRLAYAKAVPTVWAQITKLNTPLGGYYWVPDVKYLLRYLLIGILTGSALCLHRSAHVDLCWVNEDVF